MTTTNATIIANSRRLLAALEAWPAAPDASAVLAACDAVQAANDPADPVARAETEFAAAVETAVDLGDSSVVWEAMQDALRHSNTAMHDANVANFHHWLDTMRPATLTAKEIDVAAEIARGLNARPG